MGLRVQFSLATHDDAVSLQPDINYTNSYIDLMTASYRYSQIDLCNYKNVRYETREITHINKQEVVIAECLNCIELCVVCNM